MEVGKKMKTVWVIAVAFLLVGTLIGVGAGYWYRQGEVDDAFTAGMTYQEAITPEAVTPASLLCSFADGGETLAATVDADGGVDTEGDDTDTLTIENTDETRDATDLTLMLTNPVTDKEGLHDNLETDALEISVTIGGVTSKLYHDGDYTEGVVVGDLTAGGEISITMTWTAETCVAGTFQADQTYNCGLYIYQPDANYVDTVAFTLTT